MKTLPLQLFSTLSDEELKDRIEKLIERLQQQGRGEHIELMLILHNIDLRSELPNKDITVSTDEDGSVTNYSNPHDR